MVMVNFRLSVMILFIIFLVSFATAYDIATDVVVDDGVGEIKDDGIDDLKEGDLNNTVSVVDDVTYLDSGKPTVQNARYYVQQDKETVSDSELAYVTFNMKSSKTYDKYIMCFDLGYYSDGFDIGTAKQELWYWWDTDLSKNGLYRYNDLRCLEEFSVFDDNTLYYSLKYKYPVPMNTEFKVKYDIYIIPYSSELGLDKSYSIAKESGDLIVLDPVYNGGYNLSNVSTNYLRLSFSGNSLDTSGNSVRTLFYNSYGNMTYFYPYVITQNDSDLSGFGVSSLLNGTVLNSNGTYLDGVNDFINTTLDSVNLSNSTFLIGIKPYRVLQGDLGVNNGHGLFSTSLDGLEIFFNGTQIRYRNAANSTAIWNYVFSNNQEYAIGITKNTTHVSLSINGVSQGVVSMYGIVAATTIDILLGRRNGAGEAGSYYNGSILYAGLWNISMNVSDLTYLTQQYYNETDENSFINNATYFDGNSRLIHSNLTLINTTSVWYKNSSGWHNVVNSSGTFYCDAVTCTKPSDYPLVFFNTKSVSLGQGFVGQLDEFNIWNYSLNSSHIYQLYMAYDNYSWVNTSCNLNTDCGTCQKCVASSCVYQTAGIEDLKNECSTDKSCNNQSSYVEGTGFCDGSGSCLSIIKNVTIGNVCVNAANYDTNPTASVNCGTWNDCVANATSADVYYVGYNLSVCTDYDWVSKGVQWSVNSGYMILQSGHLSNCTQTIDPFGIMFNKVEIFPSVSGVGSYIQPISCFVNSDDMITEYSLAYSVNNGSWYRLPSRNGYFNLHIYNFEDGLNLSFRCDIKSSSGQVRNYTAYGMVRVNNSAWHFNVFDLGNQYRYEEGSTKSFEYAASVRAYPNIKIKDAYVDCGSDGVIDDIKHVNSTYIDGVFKCKINKINPELTVGLIINRSTTSVSYPEEICDSKSDSYVCLVQRVLKYEVI